MKAIMDTIRDIFSNVTFDQIRGPIERVLFIWLGWCVAKGYISNADMTMWATVILTLLGAFYGWWQNRPKAIVEKAARLNDTTVVTSPALAAATPNTPNIVSNTENKVVSQ